MQLDPLAIHVLYHPSSELAAELANLLVPKFLAAPTVRGLRVPIFLTPNNLAGLPPRLEPDNSIPGDPDWLDLDRAKHTIVVVLADARMNRRVDNGTGDAWASAVLQLVEEHDPTRHSVLLVSLDDQGFQLNETISNLNFLSLPPAHDADARCDELTFHIAIRALQLLRNPQGGERNSPVPVDAPVKFFLSHAKADLGAQRKGPVHRVLEEVSTMKIHHWYDAQDIAISTEFTDAIKKGIRDADLVIIFLTDSWAKSVWCRMEAAYAKEVATPVLVVDALKEGEPRSFPYGGNAKVVQWPIPSEETVSLCLGDISDPDAIERQLQLFRPIASKMLLSAALIETLTRAHHASQMHGQALEDDFPLDVTPEAVHLANHANNHSFLYPDPPLTGEEYKVLKGLRPDARFETPLMRISQMLNTSDPLCVAVSISDSENLDHYGLTPWHLQTLTDEVYLYLLVAGIQIAYGGKLDSDNLDDPDNFTLRLFNLVTGYRGLAKGFGAVMHPIVNFVPWPLWALYDDNVKSRFGTIAELKKVPRPEPGLSEDDLLAEPSGFVPYDSTRQQYAWGLGMTAMRKEITDQTTAKIVVGGKIEGYKGRYAGLIEEPLLSLRSEKPLFLLGGIGGCARLMIDLLEGRQRTEMSTAAAKASVSNYEDLVKIYHAQGQELCSREELANEIASYGEDGPKKALRNGLSDEQNRELFYCTNPQRIAELVITGLSVLK